MTTTTTTIATAALLAAAISGAAAAAALAALPTDPSLTVGQPPGPQSPDPHPTMAVPKNDEPEESRVTLRLLADTTAIEAGKPFRLGLEFNIQDEWHIYWANPGDGGLATTAEFTAPPGIKVGSLQYPGPQRFDLPGDIVSYGYTDRVVLFVEVTPPAALTQPGPYRFQASADWLACHETCVIGNGQAFVELPAATAGAPAMPDNESALLPFLEDLPRDLIHFEYGMARWSGSKQRPTIEVTLPRGSELELFPLDRPGVKMESVSVDRTTRPGELVLRATFALDQAPARPGQEPVLGVLMARVTKDFVFFNVVDRFERPAEKSSPLLPGGG